MLAQQTCEKEEFEKECESEKVLDFREDGRGRPYDSKIRELVYTFRLHNIGVEHIEPVVNSVLSLVGFKAKDLPKKQLMLFCQTKWEL